MDDDDGDGYDERGQLDFFPKLAGLDALEFFGAFEAFQLLGLVCFSRDTLGFHDFFTLYGSRFRFDPLDGRLGGGYLIYADEFAGRFEGRESFAFLGRGRDDVGLLESSISVLFVDRGNGVERGFHVWEGVRIIFCAIG